jgi:hypothetical protein
LSLRLISYGCTAVTKSWTVTNGWVDALTSGGGIIVGLTVPQLLTSRRSVCVDPSTGTSSQTDMPSFSQASSPYWSSQLISHSSSAYSWMILEEQLPVGYPVESSKLNLMILELNYFQNAEPPIFSLIHERVFQGN